jgi:hypothetical protein
LFERRRPSGLHANTRRAECIARYPRLIPRRRHPPLGCDRFDVELRHLQPHVRGYDGRLDLGA